MRCGGAKSRELGDWPERMGMNHASPATAGATPSIRTLIRVEGIVQGVGFRPFVHALAARVGVAGYVANDRRGVIVEIEGSDSETADFISRLTREAPPLAVIERVSVERVAVRGEREFRIIASRDTGARQTLIAPDTATCANCLRELFDPSDRRYRYPFTNCTNCGPRFTIVRDTPYDRFATTMARFEMCARCAREYHDPTNRRFHAQPISCPDCGPRLTLVDREGRELPGEPIETVAQWLGAGTHCGDQGTGRLSSCGGRRQRCRR